MSNDFVAIAQHKCPVCGVKHEVNEILIHKRFERIDPKNKLTGYSLCPEHQKLFDDGFVAFIGIDPLKSISDGSTMRAENAYRTGSLVHVRRSVVDKIINIPIDPRQEMVFVEEAVIDALKLMAAKAEGNA